MANNDRIYEAYMGKMGENFKQQTRDRVEWILKQVQGKETILDIGCSQGIVSILCAEQGAKVTGIEVQKNNFEYANNLLEVEYSLLRDRVKFVNMDFMEYMDDMQYDALILTEVLEHLPNAHEFLEHVVKFLKEDGILVITVPFGFCDHPDHVYTFYLSNFVELIEKALQIKSIYYGGKWIACIACKEAKKFELEKAAFVREEAAFLHMHKELDVRLKDLTAHLENSNRKYKESCEAYERIKKWYSDEQQKTAALLENYNRIKEWHEKSLEEIKVLRQQVQDFAKAYEQIKKWRENDQEKLVDVIKAEHQQLLVMQKAKGTIQKQQVEIRFLREENESYKQRLSVIYNTWYGKIAIRCYNFLKKIKRKLGK